MKQSDLATSLAEEVEDTLAPPLGVPASRIRGRLIPRGEEDRITITKDGINKMRLGDMYAQLLALRWRYLCAWMVLSYFSINILFALAYLGLGEGIENARAGSFADAFFFSVQTMSTIGYGKMVPVGLAANLLVTLEVMTGFAFFAVLTGLVFAKFSRPTARVRFSEVAVICPYEGVPHLMFRLANERNNRIVNANIHLVILRKVRTREGHEMRRFYDLDVVRARVPLLQLSWMVMHRIDESSPLYKVTPEKLQEWDAEIIVALTGIDETLSQTIHARYSYVSEDIHCNAAFVDIITHNGDGKLHVDYNRFNDVKEIAGNVSSMPFH